MSARLVLAADVETELVEKKSRFLTRLHHVDSVEQADALLRAARAEHPGARHHCTALVLEETDERAEVHRSNDDGEPAGTAGAPILDVLTGHDLTYTLAIVTRYFGGTLLGAGGLVRAYGEATSEAVAASAVVTYSQRVPVRVTVDYALAAAIDRMAQAAGWSTEADYAAEVAVTVFIPPAQVDAGLRSLADVSGGTAEPQVGEPVWAR